MARIVGRYVMIADVDETGLLIPTKTKYTRLSPLTKSLLSIWTGTEAQYKHFIDELVRNGVANEYTNEWRHGSVSLIYCYRFMTSNGLVKRNLRWTDVYAAFSGTFKLTRIKSARNLQVKESTKTKAYHDKAKYWKHFFEESFSLNGERKNTH